MMKKIRIAVFSILCLAALSASQYKPDDEKLTEDETALYYDFLNDYLAQFHKSNKALRVANRTVPFDQTGCGCTNTKNLGPNWPKGKPYEKGIEGVRFRMAQLASPAIRYLDSTAFEDLNIVWVNLDRSSPQTSENGLLILSKIVFDAKHEYAFISYEFYKSGLNAHGSDAIYKKTEGKWEKYLPLCDCKS